MINKCEQCDVITNTDDCAVCPDNVDLIEYCEYGKCDAHATGICDTCGASLCDDHMIMGNIEPETGARYTYCRKFTCIAGNAPTFATVNDVSRYVRVYRQCYVGGGMCAPFNRDMLRGRLRGLGLADNQINAFCDKHGIPRVV